MVFIENLKEETGQEGGQNRPYYPDVATMNILVFFLLHTRIFTLLGTFYLETCFFPPFNPVSLKFPHVTKSFPTAHFLMATQYFAVLMHCASSEQTPLRSLPRAPVGATL